jgi:hypothetical protein
VEIASMNSAKAIHHRTLGLKSERPGAVSQRLIIGRMFSL